MTREKYCTNLNAESRFRATCSLTDKLCVATMDREGFENMLGYASKIARNCPCYNLPQKLYEKLIHERENPNRDRR